jgi:ankyrin repeat protein
MPPQDEPDHYPANDGPASTMPVKVLWVSGAELEMKVDITNTVLKLKQDIQELTDLKLCHQKLVIGVEVLNDGKRTLASYDLLKNGGNDVTLIVRHFEGCNAVDDNGATELWRAANDGNNKEVQRLLDGDGIDVVNTVNDAGYTPLIIAARNGHTEVVKLLLDAEGIEVNKFDHLGNTPLSMAASQGHTEIVFNLIAALEGIDVNKANNHGETALFKAFVNGHTESVRCLCAVKGINVNQANNKETTPLYQAASFGRADIAKLLLAAPGIKVNQADSEGTTSLEVADSECKFKVAAEGRTKVAALLRVACEERTMVGKTGEDAGGEKRKRSSCVSGSSAPAGSGAPAAAKDKEAEFAFPRRRSRR